MAFHRLKGIADLYQLTGERDVNIRLLSYA